MKHGVYELILDGFRYQFVYEEHRITAMHQNSAVYNPDNPLDVDGDGLIVPRDALIIINEINRGTQKVTDLPSENLVNPPYNFDTTNDGWITAADVLPVINHINIQVLLQ